MPKEDTPPAAKVATRKRYQVHVTVECTCVVEVTAESYDDARSAAKSRYDRGGADVDVPHAADWRNAEVFYMGEAS